MVAGTRLVTHPLYRRYVKVLLLRGGLLGWGLALVLLTVVHLWPFPVEAVWAIGVANILLAGWTLGLEARPRVFLRELARSSPLWADRLATLRAFERRPPPAFYREALETMLRELPPLSFPGVPWRLIGLWGVWSVGLAWVWRPGAWERSVLYGQERLEIRDTVVFVGDTVVIRRFPPDGAAIRVGRREVRPERIRKTHAVYTFVPPGPGRYRVEGRVVRRWIRALPRPSLDGVVLRVRPPAYTGMRPLLLRGGDQAWVPSGSTLDVQIRLKGPGQAVRVRVDTLEKRWECPCDTLWRAGLLPSRETTEVVWVWEGERRFTVAPIRLIRLEDRPPRVEMLPSFARADQVETLTVHLVGVDDFGLSLRVLQWRTPWEQRTRRQRLSGGTEYRERLALEVASWGLLPGDTAWVRARVRDVAGQWSAWETLRVVYPDLATLAQFPDEGDLETPEESTERVQEALRRLREEVLQRGEVDVPTREAIEHQIQRQTQALETLEKQAARIQQSLEALSRLQDLDPRMVQSLQEVAQLLQEALGEELKRQMEALRQRLQRGEVSPQDMARMLEALEREQERVLRRLEALKRLLQDLKAFQEREALREHVEQLAARELEVESQTLGGAPLDSLERQQSDVAREAARLKPRLPGDLRSVMDDALRAMEEAQTAMRQGDRFRALEKAQEARETLESLADALRQRQQEASQDLARQARETLEETRWSLLGWATWRADTTPAAIPVLKAVESRVRQTSPLLYFRAFRIWQALDQAVRMLEEGRRDLARRQVHLVILGLFDLQQQMQQQGQAGSQDLEQMVQQLLEGMRQNTQALGGMVPLPLPMPRAGEGTLEALRRQMEALREQAEALRRALPEGSPARDAAGDLARALEENLRKLARRRLTREDVARQREATRKFLQALRAVHRKGFRERRRATPGKPFTPEPPDREGLDPVFEVLRQQMVREDLPPSLREMYRRLWQEWTGPSS